MTVNTLNTQTSTIADGVEVTFNFDFQTLSGGWVFAYTQNPSTLQKIPRTDINVTPNADQEANPGGTVTFDTAPANGDSVVLYRQTPVTQQTDYTDYDAFHAESTEDALDKLTLIAQERDANASDTDLVSPVNIGNESPADFPNDWQFRYGGLFVGDRPFALETIPFTGGKGAGLRSWVLYDDAGTAYTYSMNPIDGGGRAVFNLPSDPLVTDTSAAASVQFVLDNAGGPSSNPTFASMKISHSTNIPTYGNMQFSYATENLGFGNAEILRVEQVDATAGLNGYAFETTDLDNPPSTIDIYMLDGQITGAAQGTGGKNPGQDTLVTRGWVEENSGGGSGDFLADGSVPMTGQFESIDGSISAPGMSFSSNAATGVTRSGVGITEQVEVVVNGSSKININFYGVSIPSLAVSGTATFNNQRVQQVGNAASGTDAINRDTGDSRYVRTTSALVPEAIGKYDVSANAWDSRSGFQSSVTKVGTGIYDLTLSTAITGVDQIAIASTDNGGVNAGALTLSSTQIRVTMVNVNTGAFADNDFNIAVYDGP